MTRILLIFCTVGICCFGQDSKDEIIQKLISRVEALEREVAALKQPGLAETTPVPPPAPAPQIAADPAPSDDSSTSAVHEPGRFTFHGYADVDFFRNLEGDSVKRFAQGEVDLFTTVRLTPRLTALLETVLETDNQLYNASVPVNVERALLQYRQNDYFNLDIGSYRTAIGYYSTAYLRGSWLQTAITRPELFQFEDDGGFLPLHNVGVSANGQIPSGPLGLHYVAEVGSSRNYAQAGRGGVDLEQNGAINLALFARPRAIRGLDVGFSVYHDRFSPLPGLTFGRSVSTVHAVYQGHRFELLNEGVFTGIRNDADGHASIAGFYSQTGYRVGSAWTPYLRFEYANIYGHGDVLEPAQQYAPWRTIVTGGVRYDLSESIAFKVELGKETSRLRPAWIRAAAQLAFTF